MPALGTAAPAAVLVALLLLDLTTRVTPAGWAVGLLCAAVLGLLVERALTRHRVTVPGPADRVTALRAVLGCALAAVVADTFTGVAATPLLVGLATVTLLLDAVDGPVARRTGTASTFGAAFDMEVDAFVLLVLSVAVAGTVGPWVLVVGAARYALLLATRLWPWLGRPVPVRYWAKVVAATQGVALTVATAQLLPPPVTDLVLLGAVALLAESFGHQVWWLLRHRDVTSVATRLRVGTSP